MSQQSRNIYLQPVSDFHILVPETKREDIRQYKKLYLTFDQALIDIFPNVFTSRHPLPMMNSSTENDLPLYLDDIAIYLLIIGSVVFILYLHRLCSILHRLLLTYIIFACIRHVRTPPLFPSATWTDASRGEAILVVSLLISNIIPYLVTIDTVNRKSGLLSLLNMVLVSLGGRRNLITEYLEFPVSINNMIHRWTGCIATGHAIVHMISLLRDGVGQGSPQKSISGYIASYSIDQTTHGC